MSAPQADKPGDSILDKAGHSINNAVQYVSETVQGKSAEASKEANKEKAKGNVPGSDSLTDRAAGAFDAVGDKLDQSKHEGAASANKHAT